MRCVLPCAAHPLRSLDRAVPHPSWRIEDWPVKTLCTALAAVCLTGALFTAAAMADGSSFNENQDPEDQLFHVDVGLTFTEAGQHPRESGVGVGTIRVSLPGIKARLDPSLPIEPAGYTCHVTTSSYGEADTGFECSTDGQSSGAGLTFPTSVIVHLLSQSCYAPPPQGSAQPLLAEAWAAPGNPGTKPDASYEVFADGGCDSGVGEPDVDTTKQSPCIVPKLKNLTLPKATLKLGRAGCVKGKVRYVFSPKVKKGRVISQSVKPKKKLKLNSKIKLVVSLGPPKT